MPNGEIKSVEYCALDVVGVLAMAMGSSRHGVPPKLISTRCNVCPLTENDCWKAVEFGFLH